jgi:hypothetical protein
MNFIIIFADKIDQSINLEILKEILLTKKFAAKITSISFYLLLIISNIGYKIIILKIKSIYKINNIIYFNSFYWPYYIF